MVAASSLHLVHPSAKVDEAVRLTAIGESAQRKAAWRLLPVIAVGYGLAYMDRINISFAALQMNKELHFSAAVYGFGAGLFFIGYVLCEVPSNLLLLRFGSLGQASARMAAYFMHVVWSYSYVSLTIARHDKGLSVPPHAAAVAVASAASGTDGVT